jgi:hypothetical protein
VRLVRRLVPSSHFSIAFASSAKRLSTPDVPRNIQSPRRVFSVCPGIHASTAACYFIIAPSVQLLVATPFTISARAILNSSRLTVNLQAALMRQASCRPPSRYRLHIAREALLRFSDEKTEGTVDIHNHGGHVLLCFPTHGLGGRIQRCA